MDDKPEPPAQRSILEGSKCLKCFKVGLVLRAGNEKLNDNATASTFIDKAANFISFKGTCEPRQKVVAP